MNFNGNNQILNHQIAVRRRPQDADRLQKEFNQQRLNRIYSLISTRPQFIGLKAVLPDLGSVTPVAVETPALRFDVIITGAITDSTRQFTIERINERIKSHYTSNDATLKLRLSEYAGKSQPTAGFPGVFYFPCPHVLIEGQIETYKFYKADNTADPETLFLALTGFRVFAENFAETTLTPQQLDRINRAILSRPTPETITATSAVIFDADGKATLDTPKMLEPVILRGIKSTLNNSLIKLAVEGETVMTISDQGNYIPIWTLANQTESSRDLWTWQQRGVLIDKDKRFEAELINTMDGVTIDPDGEIQWIFETI